MKKRIAIVFGGNSVEHEISILSMIQASYAIDKNCYDLINIYITKEGEFWVGPKFDQLQTFRKNQFKHYHVTFYKYRGRLYLKGITPFLPVKYRKPIDIVIPVVHGNNVEDGSLAGYFNILNVPYASSSVLVAALFQNKHFTKALLSINNINVLPYFYFSFKQYKKDVFTVLENSVVLGFPLIIKPVSLGSSIGIKIAEDRDQLIKALNYVIKYDDEIIVEKKLINFRELNQAILKTESEYLLSNVEEVSSTNHYLTFDDKYLPVDSMREIPANITKEFEEEIGEISKKIAVIFKPKGVVRIDYLYDIDTETLYVNEINSIPGSLSFYLFEGKLSFSILIDKMINQAVKDKYEKGLKLTSFKSNVLLSNRQMKKK